MASSGGGSLLSFVARRLLITIPLLLLISFGVFCLVLIIPGDPAVTLAGGAKANLHQIALIRHQLHLDEPFWKQYLRWLNGLLHGNLGNSLFMQTQSVASQLRVRFPVTLSIAIGGMFFSVLLGLPAGIISGIRQGTIEDRSVTVGSSLGVAVPDFWLAIMLVTIFAVDLHWLPALGYVPFTQSPLSWADHLLLPWIALGLGGAATIARQVRGAMIDTLDQDYMRTARAKGLSHSAVIYKHALKNALTPAVTVIGISFGYLLGGTVIIEQIFSLPGIGAYALQAINDKDLPVIQGVVLLTAVCFVLINLVVDIIYGFLNPKVRLE
ncbi:MAG TPA: ABC transporter permease [Acidimicrobiales bacterium]|nr:ABC transporter permease [Acidimicrobiales bacterium]